MGNDAGKFGKGPRQNRAAGPIVFHSGRDVELNLAPLIFNAQRIKLSAGSIILGAMLATGLLLPRQVPAASSDAPKSAVRLQTITTGRSGEFRNCYKVFFFFWTRCSYRHVVLPERITVADDLVLKYGSNTKQHAFRVGQISRGDDGGCTILRDSSQQAEDGDTIEVSNCEPASSE